MSSTTVSHPDEVVLHHHGSGDRAVVFVHGFLDDAMIWERAIAQLGSEGYDYVSLDLAGCGARVGEEGPFSYQRLAADVTAALAALGRPCVLVGQSMGAAIAQLVAENRPDQCLGLVLLAPVPLAGVGLPDEAVEPFRTLGEQGPEANRALRSQLAPEFPTAELDRVTEVDRAVRPEVVRALADCWNDGQAAELRYSGPVLVVRGAHDGFVTADLAALTSARYAGARTAVLDTAGHWPHVEDAVGVAALLDDFLAGLQARKPGGWAEAFAAGSAQSFADTFAENVVLEASVLTRPIVGHDSVTRTMATAAGIYDSLEFGAQLHEGNRSHLEWRATFDGVEVTGVTILVRNEAHAIEWAAIHHRPLGAALRFSAELRKRLAGVLDSDHFHDAKP